MPNPGSSSTHGFPEEPKKNDWQSFLRVTPFLGPAALIAQRPHDQRIFLFKEDRATPRFQWADLGNIEEGRPNLGPAMPVLVYRLFQFTLRDVLIAEVGVEATNRIFWRAGLEAGKAFGANVLDSGLDFNAFIAQLQHKLKELNVGILRVERVDLAQLEFTLTVAEDLDCSGLPLSEEVVCTYDEGFISGLLEQHTGRPFQVREIDCWASGGRTCRFHARAQ